MVYCVQADLAFSTAKIRNDVLTLLQASLGIGTWGPVLLTATEVEAGANGLRVEVRYATKLAQSTFAGVIQALSGARAPRAGSSVRLHDCRHDETPPKPCTNLTTPKAW